MSLTKWLILLNVLGYFLQNSFERADLIFALNRYFFEAELFWQPLTSMFMHGGLSHLGMNMVVLCQFGEMVENSRGKLYFFILYILGGIITSLFSFVFMYTLGFNHVLVGASGAICVLCGEIAYRDVFNRKGIVVAILFISFVPFLLGSTIAWYAHLTGLFVGWLIAMLKR